MILRDYQTRTLDTVWETLQVKSNVLITAPCSAGKTILFSKIIQRLLKENPDFRALILVDREILVTQSADKLRTVAPELALDIGIVCSSVSSKKETGCRVTVASRQTLINQLNDFPPVQLIICDEVHLLATPHSDNPVPDQYAEIISRLREYNEHVRLIGCTASPYRLGSNGGYIYGNRNKDTALPYFDDVDAKITTLELLAGGYISPLVGMASIGETFAEDLSNCNMVAGEYNLGQISDMMCKPVHIQTCVDAWQKYASDRKKTLVFCTSIEHAERVAESFNAAGVSSCAIHSKLSPVDSMARMEALEHGTMQVFTSVAKLTTGMDVSDIDCIVMARPTKSTALYQQCLGRGQRLAPEKENCLVIDLTGCTTDFGTDMDNLRVPVPSSSEGGEAPKKICPGNNQDGSVCGQAVHASLRYCPYCGFMFPVTEAMETKLGTMKKVTFNEIPKPEPYDVTYVNYEVHLSKKTDKELIKVTYECGHYSKFNEWVCLPDYYSGFAVDKARGWWEHRTDEPFPVTVDEFMFLKDELMEPKKIMVIMEGKWGRVVECMIDDEIDEADVRDYLAQDEIEFSGSDVVPF